MYTINGFIKDITNKFIPNAKVYVYFKKVDSSSSNSKWATPNYVTSSVGYYSVTLEDSQWLGINATYKRNLDKVWIAVVWNENNSGLATLTSGMTHASFFEHNLTNSDVNSINLTLETIRLPIFNSYNFSSNNILTQTNYTLSETSFSDYSYKALEPYSNNKVTQINVLDSVPVFPNHILDDTEYSWGDGTIGSTRNKPNNTSDSFIYQKAGVFTQKIKIKEKWGTFTEVTKTVTVKYNEPIVDFDFNPKSTNSWEGNKIKGTEEITFTNTSSDKDNRTKDNNKWLNETYYYEWIISDTNLDFSDNTQIYSSKDWYFSPKHKFQSSGNKIITLKIFWNDGFENKVKEISKTLIIDEYNIIPDFSWSKTPRHRNDLITFTSTTTGDINNIIKYNWVIEDNYPAPSADLYTFSNLESSIFNEGSPDNSKRIDNNYNIETTDIKTAVKFHSIEPKNITLTITYFNGWKNVTKNITKVLTPTKQNIIPDFSISTIPKGRNELVRFNNITNYMFGVFNLAYSVDWKINDFYSLYNLDNPNYGVIENNTKNYLNEPYNKEQTHYFQNSEVNEIELTIRYDDGYQMQTKRIIKTVQPMIYDGIIPDFSFNTPNSRFDKVIIENKTLDIFNRFRKIEYFLTDKFNKYNPDNANYGLSETNNSKYFQLFVKNNIEHYYQDSNDETIKMKYYYDDGFEEKMVEVEKIITKGIITCIPDFKPNINPINNGFIGKKEIIFKNTTLNSDIIQDEKWIFNDREFTTELDNIKIREKQIPFSNQSFIFKTPSRLPFSSEEFKVLNLLEEQNLNKTVSLELRIDNGWRNDTDLKSHLDPLNDDIEVGGKVYYFVEKNYEASPNEVESDIFFNTNIDNYVH